MPVLIVEDEPLARANLARVLSARDDIESFDSTSNAVEGRDNLERSSDDVMLLDINMPEISGLNFAGSTPGEQTPSTIRRLCDCMRRTRNSLRNEKHEGIGDIVTNPIDKF